MLLVVTSTDIPGYYLAGIQVPSLLKEALRPDFFKIVIDILYQLGQDVLFNFQDCVSSFEYHVSNFQRELQNALSEFYKKIILIYILITEAADNNIRYVKL